MPRYGFILALMPDEPSVLIDVDAVIPVKAGSVVLVKGTDIRSPEAEPDGLITPR
jgi:hypothetical protein